MEAKQKLSVRDMYENRHILLVGASGFLGKVWLSMILDRIPNVGRIYVLLRPKGKRTAIQRFEQMVNSSFVFRILHERYGSKLSSYISQRVEVISGDFTKPNLDMDPETSARLKQNLDLAVNCAGLVDFNPDLRDALLTNVEGTLNLAKFVRNADHASLLHVSTCYVAGTRQGHIPEKLFTDLNPKEDPFSSEREYQRAQQEVEKICAEAGEIRTLRKRKELWGRLIEAGKKRAQALGWPNTYTYTKALAETLLVHFNHGLRFSIFRPSIVESSLEYPFPGWNEGFNTCGPLAHLLSTWFRYFPAKKGNPFDVVPVDLVCKGITTAGAALMAGVHEPVYQCGTSDLNLLTIDQAAELTSLSYRIQYRQNGKTFVERSVRSRWRVISVGNKHPLSVANLRAWIQKLGRLVDKLRSKAPPPLRVMPNRASDLLRKSERRLQRIHHMLDLFMPFIHDNHQVFETKALRELNVEEEFQFKPEDIDWDKYWLRVQMPGLRRWCFPVMEGKKEEQYYPQAPFQLQNPSSTPQQAVR